MTDSSPKSTRRGWHWALKRRSFSFLVVLGLVALWCTASWAWWLQSIPLLPNWTIPLADRHILPPSPVMDRLVLVRQHQDGNRTLWTGPIDFYESTNGRFLNTVLTERDEILIAHSWGWDAAVIRRDQEVHLVDLQTGSSRAVLDIKLSKRTWGEPAFFDRGQIVVLNDGENLHAFSTANGARQWMIRDGYISNGGHLTSRWRYIPYHLMKGNNRRTRLVAVAQTGKELAWVTEFGTIQHVVPSQCGQFLFLESWGPSGSMSIYRASDGTELFRAHSGVQLASSPEEKAQVEAFWETVKPYSKLSSHQSNTRNPQWYLESPDEDLQPTLTTRIASRSAFSETMTRIWPDSAKWIAKIEGVQPLEIYDSNLLETVGRFPLIDMGTGRSRWLNYKSGLLIETDHGVTFVGPPFHRNWSVLAMLTCIPSLFFLAVWALVDRRLRPHSDA